MIVRDYRIRSSCSANPLVQYGYALHFDSSPSLTDLRLENLPREPGAAGGNERDALPGVVFSVRRGNEFVLDMNLPGMSGIDLQRQLNDSGVEIPIVFISAQAEEATRHAP